MSPSKGWFRPPGFPPLMDNNLPDSRSSCWRCFGCGCSGPLLVEHDTSGGRTAGHDRNLMTLRTLWTTNDAFWVGSGHIPPYSTYAGVAEIVKLATSWNTMVQSVNCLSKVGNKGDWHSFSNRFCIFAGLENVLSHGVCSFRQGNGSLTKYFGKSAEGKVRIADAKHACRLEGFSTWVHPQLMRKIGVFGCQVRLLQTWASNFAGKGAKAEAAKEKAKPKATRCSDWPTIQPWQKRWLRYILDR